MADKALQTPGEPVAMAIVDDTGNLVAYAKMDNLRIFSRRHALRKAYTAAIVGMDSGAHAERLQSGSNVHESGEPARRSECDQDDSRYKEANADPADGVCR